MSSFSMTDCTTWIAGHDFTTEANELSINIEAEDLDNTTFGLGGYRSRIGGLKNIEASLSGYLNTNGSTSLDPDSSIFPALGTADQVITQAWDDAELSVAYMYQAGEFSYTPFGDIGNVTPYQLDLRGSNFVGVKRGVITKARGNVSATGAVGTAWNGGNVASGQYLYATFHVFSAGTTITAVIESDDNAGFSSATTRITFGPITTAGGTWGTRLAGPLTETHYRLRVTAITGTFNIGAAIAIGS